MADIKELKYYRYVVREDTTVNDLISDEFSIFKNYQNRISEFYLVKFNNISNLDRIYNGYSTQDKNLYTSQYISGSLENINADTVLIIPETDVPVELVSITGKNLFLDQDEYSSFAGFWTEQYKAINNDPNNTQSIKPTGTNVELKQYEISVWVYIKALDKVKDFTDFVQDISMVNSLDDGGSFNITLDGKTRRLEDVTRQLGDTISHRHFVNENTLEISFFSKYVQKNDVVFIRLEKLDLETRRQIAQEFNNYDVNKGKL